MSGSPHVATNVTFVVLVFVPSATAYTEIWHFGGLFDSKIRHFLTISGEKHLATLFTEGNVNNVNVFMN